MSDLSWKCHENPVIRLSIMLLTHTHHPPTPKPLPQPQHYYRQRRRHDGRETRRKKRPGIGTVIPITSKILPILFLSYTTYAVNFITIRFNEIRFRKCFSISKLPHSRVFFSRWTVNYHISYPYLIKWRNAIVCFNCSIKCTSKLR